MRISPWHLNRNLRWKYGLQLSCSFLSLIRHGLGDNPCQTSPVSRFNWLLKRKIQTLQCSADSEFDGRVAPRVDGRLTAQATRRGWPEPDAGVLHLNPHPPASPFTLTPSSFAYSTQPKRRSSEATAPPLLRRRLACSPT